ncbi:hypothetical protein [Luteimonas aquatica]|uniref:hypothetical protein n=1 Tax=Luteimonas aquatica TaxID=450364 RepID=UPI001F57305D|nr:hypothetical protein [Luteimonas aquatica]
MSNRRKWTRACAHLKSMSSAVALAVPLSVPIGFSLLYFYGLEYGIPFSTPLSDVVALLVLIAGVAALIIALTAAYLMAPGLLSALGVGQGFDLLFVKEKRIASLMFVLALPVFAFDWALLAATFLEGEARFSLLPAVLVGLVSFIWRVKLRARDALVEDWVIYQAALAYLAIFVVWTLLVIALIVPLQIWPEIERWALQWFAPQLATSIALAALVMAPIAVAIGFAWIGMVGRERSRPEGTPLPWWMAVPALIFVVSVFTPPGASFVGGLVLATLNLGGGQPACFSPAGTMPPEIRARLGMPAKASRYPPLRVALSFGSQFYLLERIEEAEPFGSRNVAVEYPREWFMHRRPPTRQRDGEGKTVLVCRPISATAARTSP